MASSTVLSALVAIQSKQRKEGEGTWVQTGQNISSSSARDQEPSMVSRPRHRASARTMAARAVIGLTAIVSMYAVIGGSVFHPSKALHASPSKAVGQEATGLPVHVEDESASSRWRPARDRQAGLAIGAAVASESPRNEAGSGESFSLAKGSVRGGGGRDDTRDTTDPKSSQEGRWTSERTGVPEEQGRSEDRGDQRDVQVGKKGDSKGTLSTQQKAVLKEEKSKKTQRPQSGGSHEVNGGEKEKASQKKSGQKARSKGTAKSAITKTSGKAKRGAGSKASGQKSGRTKAVANAIEGFPPLEESTVMFLHVFKCAGSTLRRMLVDWAKAEGKSGAVVVKCDAVIEDGTVCLSHYELLNEQIQKAYMAQQKVLAGHFIWGFQRHVETPYLMITALRNPLELYVSAQQYINRKETKAVDKAALYISASMGKTLRRGGPGAVPGTWNKIPKRHVLGNGLPPEGHVPGQVTGFIRRFVGADRKTLHGNNLEGAAQMAIQNMESLWVVGVVEQYAGFEQVLKRLLDPEGRHKALWDKYATRQYNTSPFSSHEVLAAIDHELIRRFNESLSLQWSLYGKAVELWDNRCRMVLPEESHGELCTVKSPAARYE